jgi:NADH-quinone oxidoreductase subunit M
MSLVCLIFFPLLGGALAAVSGRWSRSAPRFIALAALLLALALAVWVWITRAPGAPGHWMVELDRQWIPDVGIRFHLAADGLSILLLVLTFFLGVVAVLTSWSEIEESVGFFHWNLCWVLAGVAGVFLAMDLFLFYFAWELMLVPMYFLIAIWGHERRVYAATKFFIFTQLSGLLMLLAILGLGFAYHRATGRYSFEYGDLLGTPLSAGAARWMLLGFFVAFAVKMPMFPLHTWLPDAHTEAPTAGSVVLAGLLLKTGAYGMIRFVLPLFPAAAGEIAPWAMWLGVAGILYGALLAFAQTDLKRLVAYTSVSHLGFVLLGIFSGNALALSGAVLEMVCHGLSTGALFVIAGQLQERLHTRQLDRMGGLWSVAPRLSGAGLFFALASLGLPGLGNFVAEFLVLAGAYRVSPTAAVAAAVGVLASTFYALRFVQRAFHGEIVHPASVPDLRPREALTLFPMIAFLVLLGLYPRPVLDTFRPAPLIAQAQASAAPPGGEAP